MNKLLIRPNAGIAVLAITATFLYSCNSSKTVQGGAVGAAAGGVIGAVIGNQSGSTVEGAIFGAMVGGAAGLIIGDIMDKQTKKLREDLEGAEIIRVGEGIRITFDSGVMFATNEHQLNAETKANLAELSKTLLEYEDTEILIEGHTDDTGSEEYNQTLSEKRANSVSQYLATQGVTVSRITTKGYGELQPRTDNSTEAGKGKNRRVEVAIYANEKMRKAAERGDLETK